MMTEGIVHRFKAIQINEHQRETPALLFNLGHGLTDPVIQQHSVGQTSQGVVQCQVSELFVGLRQRLCQQCGSRLQSGVKNRCQ